MAKKNGRDDPPKPQVSENEQMSDIVFILDKMELILQAVPKSEQGRQVQDGSGRQGTPKFLSENRPLRQHVREFPEELLEPAQRPDTVRHPLRQGGHVGHPEVRQAVEDIAAGKKTKSRGGISQEIRDCPAQQGKPKYKPSKSRRNGKEKMKPSSRLPRMAASSNPVPSTVTTSP